MMQFRKLSLEVFVERKREKSLRESIEDVEEAPQKLDRVSQTRNGPPAQDV